MPKTKTYTVATSIKIRGKWHLEGARVVLTDAEAEMYAAGLAETEAEPAGAGNGGYLPGQEPQAPTPVAPLLIAQAAAGDRAAEAEMDRREGDAYGQTALEGRGDVGDSRRHADRYQDRMMRTGGEAALFDGPPYLPGQEPQTPTPVAEPTPDQTPAPVQESEPAAAPQEPTPTTPIEAANPAAETETTLGDVSADTPRVKPSGVTVEHVGGGWYEVRNGDVVLEKVQGKENAERFAAGVAPTD